MSAPFFLVIFIIIIVGVVAYFFNLKRQKEWQEFAARHGFSFNKKDLEDLAYKYSNYQLFCQGHSRRAYNVCRGREKEAEICAFDYKYTTGSGKNQQTHFFTVLSIDTPLVFQPLFIRPEGIFDKLTAAFGFDDIDFESAEFSKKFYVKCENKKFAYDIIHAQMMEFLLSSSKPVIEARSRIIIFHQNKRLSISEVELLLMEAHKFITLTPGYVKQEISLLGTSSL